LRSETSLTSTTKLTPSERDPRDWKEAIRAMHARLDTEVGISSAHDFLIRYLRARARPLRHKDSSQLSYFVLDTAPSSEVCYLLHFISSHARCRPAAVFVTRKIPRGRTIRGEPDPSRIHARHRDFFHSFSHSPPMSQSDISMVCHTPSGHDRGSP